MVELLTHEDQKGLVTLYHASCQSVAVVTSAMTALLVFFSQGVVYAWSGNVSLAEQTGSFLSVLAMGMFLNGLMQMPFHLQLAHGWTGLSIRVNIVAVLALIPSLLWAVARFGPIGAAWIWVVLNAGYVLCAVQFMHLRVMPKEKWRWYVFDVLLPMAGAIGIMIIAQQVQPAAYESRVEWVLFLSGAGVLAFGAAAMLAENVRSQLLAALHFLYSHQPRTRMQSS
jgi:hypothetical protein